MVADNRIKTKPDLLRVISKAGVLDDDALASLRGAKDGAEAVKLLKTNGAVLSGLSDADVARIWSTPATIDATKTVRITVDADAGEDVEMLSPQAEPDDTEAMDEEEEDGEKSARPTSQKARLADPDGKAMGRKLMKAGGFGKPAGPYTMAERRYDRAVKDGRHINGRRPVFESGEQAAAFGAWFRSLANMGKAYAHADSDRDILTKAHVTYDNALGGALIPEDFSANLIDVKNEFGAARRAVGVTTMARETLTMPRIASDAVVDWVGEASTQTAQSTPTFDQVTLVAKKAGAYFTMSSELMNDAAVNVADVVAVSLGRAFGEFEDDAFFLGQNDTVGLNDLIPASASTAIYDSASGGWSGYTTSDITSWLGKIPDAAWRKGNVSIVCSVNFYHSVLLSLAQSAGGATPRDLLGGVGGRFRQGAIGNADAQFDGIPVYFTSSAPTSYSDGQIIAWAGAFDLGAKFGEVSGSNSIATSEHAAFASDQIAVRALERIALTPHDIQDDANSMVIALED